MRRTNSIVKGDEILVTARGYQTPVSKTPGSIGIIASDDAENREAVSVPDLFKLVPGVEKTEDGAWGADANIRGLSRESVVFLIDGCRVNTATDLGARFGLVDPLEVDRVEILKGPISSLYGSGSIGGVVNVITKTGCFTAEPEWHSGVSGSWESNPEGFNTFGFADYNSSNEYLYASQTYRNHDSYEDGDGHEVRNSQFEDMSTRIRGGYRVSSVDMIEANVEYFEGRDIGIPGSGTAPLPSAADVTYDKVERELFSIVDSFKPQGSTLKESSLNLYYQYIQRHVRIDAFPSSNAVKAMYPSAANDTYGAKWINVLGIADQDVTVGVDVWDRYYDGNRLKYLANGNVTSDKPLPDASYLSEGIFAEDNWNVSKAVTLNAGGRVDGIRVENDADAQWSARTGNDASWDAHAGGTWNVTHDLNMKIIGASGYRAASLEERYQYLELGSGIVKYGNPDLKPERSLFFEYSLNWYGDSLFWGVSAFYNKLDDMIGEKFIDSTTIENENINKAEIHGFEAEIRWAATSVVQLYGNLAYATGRDTSQDEYLSGIAPLTGLAGVAYGLEEGFWARAETTFVARQNEVPSDVSEAPGWVTVDTRVGWKHRTHGIQQSFYVGVDNLFDKAYRDYLTTYRGNMFNEPGRSYIAGCEMAF